MTGVLVLFLALGLLGAWDTLWYHEYRTRLTARLEHTRTELILHVARDAIYVVLYGLLAWWRPTGALVIVVAGLLVSEIVITLFDFVVEDRDRPAIGGMAPGERVLHSLMAILYGAMLLRLGPELFDGWSRPTGLERHGAAIGLSVAMTIAALGIAASGARDAAALRGHDPIWSRAIPTSGSDPDVGIRRQGGGTRRVSA